MSGASSLGLDVWNLVLYMGRHAGASLDRLEERRPFNEVQKEDDGNRGQLCTDTRRER